MYRKVMIATGVGAAVAIASYTAAALMAVSDDVELPHAVGIISCTLILGLGLMSYTAWLLQRANLDKSADAVADAVVDRLADRLTTAISEGAERSHSRTVAAFREIVTSEIVTEQLEAAARRIHRYGMITEAAGRANVAQIPRRN